MNILHVKVKYWIDRYEKYIWSKMKRFWVNLLVLKVSKYKRSNITNFIKRCINSKFGYKNSSY